MKFFISICLMASVYLQADEYKAVFDCSSKSSSFIKSRMWLVGKTMDMMQEEKNTLKVALTLHGDCVPMVTTDYDMIVDEKDVENTKQAQAYLKELSKRKGVEIVACQMSLDRLAIDKETVLPFIKVSKNSFLDTIKYQNKGYALMTFK